MDQDKDLFGKRIPGIPSTVNLAVGQDEDLTEKHHLKGSPSRDLFKFNHKKLNRRFWGCDIDFVLLDKYPFPDIVAALDYKKYGDEITFSEVIVYNALIIRGIKVYIVEGDADAGAFRISEYVGGHHAKPSYELVLVCNTENWDEFGEWEKSLRLASQRRFMRKEFY
jgi:hypothetical protein